MTKLPENHRKQWTSEAKDVLQDLANKNTPTRVIGIKLGRTEASIESMASELGVSLKPTNQSPYNRRSS